MKEKILISLKTKYKTLGFGDKAFDGVADFLSKTVTEESQIETAIGGVEGLLKAFQGDIDSVRNEKAGLQKQLDELKKPIDKPDPNPNPNPDGKKEEVPAWAQELIDSYKALGEKMTAMDAKSKADARNMQIEEVAKSFGIPEIVYKGKVIAEDADLNQYFTDLKQGLQNSGFQFAKTPEEGISEQKSEISSLAEQINKGTQELINKDNK